MWGWLPPLRQTAHEPPFSTQLWTPPTPPQDDSDVYIDPVVCLTYEATPIPESKLPPVYVRRERRRHKTDPSGAHLFLSPPFPPAPSREGPVHRSRAGGEAAGFTRRHGDRPPGGPRPSRSAPGPLR